MDGGVGDAGCTLPQHSRALVSWTDLTSSDPFCEFYSAPGDDALEYLLGDTATLDVTDLATILDISGSQFSAVTDGFDRQLQCPASRTDYIFTETLRGTWAPDGTLGCASQVFTGTYSYTECAFGPSRLCVSDGVSCAQTANVTIRLVAEDSPLLDGGVGDSGTPGDEADVQRCAAMCAAQEAAGPVLGCSAIPDCATYCVEGYLNPFNPKCVDEQRTLDQCTVDNAQAPAADLFECVGPDLAVAYAGLCGDAYSAFNACLFRGEPTGMCVVPEPQNGTAMEGQTCLVNTDCVPGLYCGGAACTGEGTCAPVPAASACMGTPAMTVCGCDSTAYRNACAATVAAVRVRSTGPCN